MADASEWSKAREATIRDMRDSLLSLFITAGFDVIIDDTNLDLKHEVRIREICTNRDCIIVVKEFKTSLAECIERDAKRENPVGEKVIREMNARYNWVQEPIEKYIPNSTLPHAIICDIDGTLAHMTGRSPYDYTKVGEDVVDWEVRSLLRIYRSNGHRIIILSGRDGSCEQATKEWLTRNSVNYDELYMRPAGNGEKDNVIKYRLFNEHIRDRYYIPFVLDDRDRVVKLWREMGLKCFQVADGNF